MSFAPLSPDFIRALCAAAAPTLPRVRLFGLDHLRLSQKFGGFDLRLTNVGGEVVPELLG